MNAYACDHYNITIVADIYIYHTKYVNAAVHVYIKQSGM